MQLRACPTTSVWLICTQVSGLLKWGGKDKSSWEDALQLSAKPETAAVREGESRVALWCFSKSDQCRAGFSLIYIYIYKKKQLWLSGSTWSNVLTFAVTLETQHTLAAVNHGFATALRAPVVWVSWLFFCGGKVGRRPHEKAKKIHLISSKQLCPVLSSFLFFLTIKVDVCCRTACHVECEDLTGPA